MSIKMDVPHSFLDSSLARAVMITWAIRGSIGVNSWLLMGTGSVRTHSYELGPRFLFSCTFIFSSEYVFPASHVPLIFMFRCMSNVCVCVGKLPTSQTSLRDSSPRSSTHVLRLAYLASLIPLLSFFLSC